MPILITGMFGPSGGAGAFNLYDPADIEAGNLNVAIVLVAGGKITASGIVGQVVVQTGAGVPVHTADEGCPYWDTTNNKLYVNNDGATGWTDVGAGGAHPDLATHDALGLATDAELAAHTGDPTAAHAASAVSNAPAGSIAATDVQAAINELDGDVSAVGGAVAAHLVDASDAHDASAVSSVPAGTVAATNVQAAIDELATDYAAADAAALAALKYQTLRDETTAVTQRAEARFVGGGVKVQDNASGWSDVVIGAYYDAIVDNADTNAVGKGNVYATLVAAIAAGHRAIFVRGTAGDSSDLTIASGDSVRRIIGQDVQTTLVPVNVTCNKSSVLLEALQFFTGAIAKYLKIASGDVVFGCLFLGALASRTALINMADGTPVAITSSTNASPINIVSTAHGLVTGDGVVIAGHTTNTNANGRWTVIRIDNNNYTLNGSLGNGVGGATGTGTKQGLNQAGGTSIVYDNGTADLIPTRGVIRIDNEFLGYTAGGGATSGTLTTGSNTRGTATPGGAGAAMQESAPQSHSDNATITSLYDGHVAVAGTDCTVIQCRFIACSNNNVHCIVVFDTGSRARLISNVALSNSTFSIICGVPEGSTASQTPSGVQIIGWVFDSNTCTDLEVTCLPRDDLRTAGEIASWALSGNLWKNSQGGAIMLHAVTWNITGNTIDGTLANNRSANLNKTGGVSAGDTVIPYDGEGGVGSFERRGVLLIGSEIVLYGNDTGTQFEGCVRGALGTTAAVHADNDVINNKSQRAFYNRQTGTSNSGSKSHLISGCTIAQTNVVYISNGGNTNHCRVTFADNIIGDGSFYIYSDEHANWINNLLSELTIDCRSKTNQVFFGGKLRTIAFLNVASDTFMFVPGAESVTGVSTTLMIPAGRIFALGRVAGDLVQIAVPMTNKTGAASVAAALVCVDNATDNAFDDNPGAASSRVCGVCIEAGIADGSAALVAIAGVVTVTCTTAGAVVRGDILEFSATGGQAQTSVAPPTDGIVFGRAMTAKAAATPGSVKCLLKS